MWLILQALLISPDLGFGYQFLIKVNCPIDLAICLPKQKILSCLSCCPVKEKEFIRHDLPDLPRFEQLLGDGSQRSSLSVVVWQGDIWFACFTALCYNGIGKILYSQIQKN